VVAHSYSDGDFNPPPMAEIGIHGTRAMAGDGRGDTSRGNLYSPYTIDTFSFAVSLFLKTHPLYAAGRKYAHYSWTRPPQPPTHGKTEPEVTSHGKEAPAAAAMDSAANIQLPPRPRRTDCARLRTHHPHRLAVSKATAKGGTPE